MEFVKAEAAFSTNPRKKRKIERKTEVKEQDENAVIIQAVSQLTSETLLIFASVFCAQNIIHSCKKFQEMKLKQRIDFIRNSVLCFGCLRVGHISKRCLTIERSVIYVNWNTLHCYMIQQSGSEKECSTQISTNSDLIFTPMVLR